MDTLKQKDIKEYREAQLLAQDSMCPLCGLTIQPEEAVLDHCHTEGHVRMVLHRSCNSAEGRILHWAGRMSKGDCHVTFVENLLDYWRMEHSVNPKHPKHGKPKTKRKRK